MKDKGPPDIIVLADIFADNGYKSAGGRVYDINGVCATIGASHFEQVKYIYVDSIEERENSICEPGNS